MEIKICRECNKLKNIFGFHKKGDGFSNWCKECTNKYKKEYNKTEKHKQLWAKDNLRKGDKFE